MRYMNDRLRANDNPMEGDAASAEYAQKCRALENSRQLDADTAKADAELRAQLRGENVYLTPEMSDQIDNISRAQDAITRMANELVKQTQLDLEATQGRHVLGRETMGLRRLIREQGTLLRAIRKARRMFAEMPKVLVEQKRDE